MGGSQLEGAGIKPALQENARFFVVMWGDFDLGICGHGARRPYAEVMTDTRGEGHEEED